jgi:outer membrane protein TolC
MEEETVNTHNTKRVIKLGLLRNKFPLILIISIYFQLFPSISAFSQSDSLYNYLEIAAKKNPTVLQKFSEYQAALQKIPQVGSLSDPELSLGVFLKPMELVSGNQVADIRLMQMFPWFGVLKNAKDEMSLMANAKYEVFRDAKLQIFYDVQRTWYDLYKIQNNISISEKNIEILQGIERLALVKFKAGPSGSSGVTSSSNSLSAGSSQSGVAGSPGMQAMGNGQGSQGSSSAISPQTSMQTGSMGPSSGSSGLADLYRIQMERGELENNIALLKNQERSVAAQFNSFLDRPPLTPVFTEGTINTDTLDISLIAVSDSIILKNPMLTMLEFEKLSIEARKKMVAAMGYPMVGLGINYSLIEKTNSGMASSDMNGNDMIMPMVTITLPVYRKKYNAMINEADFLKTATSQNYQATVNALQTEYYQAIQLYQDARRRVILYENQFQLASKSFDLLLKDFSTSSSELTDVLRVRQQMLDYEFKKVEATADFNTSVAWLKRLGDF